jgi:hypothetical protein
VKDLVKTLGLIAAALALVAVAVFGGGDRQLLVPPPDSSAESFVRQLTTGRYDLATKYLASDLRRTVGEKDLRSRYEPLRTALGPINQVGAEIEFIGLERAGARASIAADNGRVWMPMRFTRELGLWVVSDLPEPIQLQE